MDDLRESYRLLEVEPGASPEEVKRAYRDLVKVWHPDRFADDPRLQSRAQEKLKQINFAYGKASEARVVSAPRPPAAPASVPRRPEPPAWSDHSGPRWPGGAGATPETELPPPPRKRNWEPMVVRVAVSLFILFQLAALAVIASVIGAALAAKP